MNFAVLSNKLQESNKNTIIKRIFKISKNVKKSRIKKKNKEIKEISSLVLHAIKKNLVDYQ
jgi:hypothetical protein